jgi:signal transduction histidine kinase
MRERAELVGGKVTVRSGPETGTEVEFRAPGSRAYSKSTLARSLLLKMFASKDIAE